MEKKSFAERLRTAYQRYDRMMEKQGFYVVLGVCITVIAVSAAITFCQRREAEIPVVVESVEPAGGNQLAQSLDEATASFTAEPLAVPTEAPLSFGQPVSGVTIRQFSMEEPQYFAASGTWQLHSGVDLHTDYGTPVAASAAGRVVAAGESGPLGLCVEIAHADGYSTLYAGLSEAGLVQAGDPVYRGQIIGLAGDGIPAESSDGPHLHFEVRRDGRPVDPLLVFLGIDKNDTL